MSVKTTPRILLVQNSSIEKTKGGVEYYLSDFSRLCQEMVGFENVRSVVQTSSSRNRYLRMLENRLSSALFRRVNAAMVEFKPDLLIIGHLSLSPMALFFSRKFKVPFATIAHGIECWGDLWPQDAFAFHRSDWIIPTGNWTRQVLISQGYPPEQFRVVHPYLTSDFVQVPLPHRIPEKKVRFLTVSRLDENEQYKGHDDMLTALVELKRNGSDLPIEYVIQGEGSDRARLEEMVRFLGLKDWVKFRDSVKERRDLIQTYLEADIYAMPARFGYWGNRWRGEGFGMVYLEAMATGLPVLAYQCGGVTDIVEDQKTGLLVEPESIDQLKAAILNLVSDAELRNELGNIAYRECRARFSIANSKRELAQVLTQLN